MPRVNEAIWKVETFDLESVYPKIVIVCFESYLEKLMIKSTVISLFFGIVICVLPDVTYGEDWYIKIPRVSGMQPTQSDQDSGEISFSGQVQLRGHLLLRSYQNMIDGEVEWRVALLFQPSITECDKLPQVRYTSEDEQCEPWIELNIFQKEQIAGVLEAIFGSEVATQSGKHIFELGKEGLLTLTSFRTGMVCNNRYYEAEIVSFENHQDMSSEQMHKLTEKMPHFCWGWFTLVKTIALATV